MEVRLTNVIEKFPIIFNLLCDLMKHQLLATSAVVFTSVSKPELTVWRHPFLKKTHKLP